MPGSGLGPGTPSRRRSRAWRGLDRFEGRAGLRTWLSRSPRSLAAVPAGPTSIGRARRRLAERMSKQLARYVDAFQRDDMEALTELIRGRHPVDATPSGPGGAHEPWALQVLQVRDGRIADMVFFLDTGRLFPLSGLPPSPPVSPAG